MFIATAASTAEATHEATLNDAVQRAAAATGAVYVDMNTVSEGHDACAPLGVKIA